MIRILAIGAGVMPPSLRPDPDSELRAVRSVLRHAIIGELEAIRGEVPAAVAVLIRWRKISPDREKEPVGPTVTLQRADMSRETGARLDRITRAALAWGALEARLDDDGHPAHLDDETREDAAWALVGLASGRQEMAREWLREAVARCAIHAL